MATQAEIDAYLTGALTAHTPPNPTYNALQIMSELNPHILAWANGHLYQPTLHGSVSKGTAITGSSDIDIFISLNPSVSTCNTYEDVYSTLRNRLNGAGYKVREQNVSVNITHRGLSIDLVAGVQQQILGSDHHIWKRKARTWTKTNIDTHVKHISQSGRTNDIKLVKIWRKLRDLDFSSFYLELSVIEALKGTLFWIASPSAHFLTVMNYLKDDFLTTTIKDPANQANEVSDELTTAEKKTIRDAAVATLQGSWEQAIR